MYIMLFMSCICLALKSRQSLPGFRHLLQIGHMPLGIDTFHGAFR